MIGYWISRILDRICDLTYYTEPSGTDDDKWEWEDWNE